MPTIEAKQILAATTDAADSTSFSVYKDRPYSVFVFGLAGVEVAALEVSLDDGNTYTAVSDDNGAITCTVSKNSLFVEGPGIYRLAKDATVGAVAVVAFG